MPQGDENLDEFVQELTRHQVDLFYFIRALTGDMHAAYDVRQAVNMVLWNKRCTFEPGSSFKAWSFKIAQFEVKDYLRKQKASRVISFDQKLLELFAEEFVEATDELPDRRQALTVCLQKVTPKDRELLRHRYWSGSTLETLADRSKRSVGTLKARLFQLRAGLRRCIEDQLQVDASL